MNQEGIKVVEKVEAVSGPSIDLVLLVICR